MAHLDKPDLVLMRPQRLKEPINAIAGQSKHCIDTPADKALDDQVSNCFGHVFSLIAQLMAIFSISAHSCLQERSINHASILLRHRILSDSCHLGL